MFSVDPETDKLTVVYSFGESRMDGTHPYAGLMETNGKLYGTTSAGGIYNSGSVFAITP